MTLGKNLDVLAALVDVLARMENPTSEKNNKSKSRENVRTATAAKVRHLVWASTSQNLAGLFGPLI